MISWQELRKTANNYNEAAVVERLEQYCEETGLTKTMALERILKAYFAKLDGKAEPNAVKTSKMQKATGTSQFVAYIKIHEYEKKCACLRGKKVLYYFVMLYNILPRHTVTYFVTWKNCITEIINKKTGLFRPAFDLYQ